jgi:hypothetical protein
VAGTETNRVTAVMILYRSKWVRIIYRCWKDGKPYDEEIYLQSLRRRSSLLGGVLGLTTGVGWKSVAGFQKPSKKILED